MRHVHNNGNNQNNTIVMCNRRKGWILTANWILLKMCRETSVTYCLTLRGETRLGIRICAGLQTKREGNFFIFLGGGEIVKNETSKGRNVLTILRKFFESIDTVL